jgi:23S rRNA pseudouridine955/2504/2580 synthase
LVRVVARVALRGDSAPLTLLAVTIKTGRTHQIRVHLASAGHAIAGDDKYGESARQRALQKLGLKRMFLHAWRLQFTHPVSGQRVALQTDLPPELRALMPAAALEALAQHPTPTAHD